MSGKILKGVNKYYSEKLGEHGRTPKGVDWNSQESQYLRFAQLCRVIIQAPLNILDYGCGYGELVNYLRKYYTNEEFNYTGYDISDSMIVQAKELFQSNTNVSFLQNLSEEKFDYVVASGIFNVRLDLATDNEWKEYIIQTLQKINSLSVKGFSFNALTSYSDPEHMKDYLYYSDPLWLFDYCKLNFSKNVALLHDYELYEFTMIIRK